MATVSTNSKTVTNIVRAEALRKVQATTLETLAEALKNSFGPVGTNSCIKRENAYNQYSKDGHTILSNIAFNGMIEQSIKDDVESITRHIVKTVGDGTTSAVLLSNIIFKKIMELEKKGHTATAIQKSITTVCDMISERIRATGRNCELEDIWNICMIATNGNKTVSDTIFDIYKEMGMEVFIDVNIATGTDSMIKYYDGMTINSGFSDSIYVNNAKENTATIDRPEVYFFEHPIDTREMSVYFDAIVSENIVKPFVELTQNGNRKAKFIPTVIIAPRLSQDLCGTMDSIVAAQSQLPPSNKLPILIITNTHQINEIMDLCKLCGARPIRKYIDAKIQAEDIKNGKAPTPKNIREWSGRCDRVVADSGKTKFINPKEMYTEDGSKSTVYNNLLDFLETELKKSIDGGMDAHVIGGIKRRIHSLKSNMVEYYIGGITMADRDSVKDLVEDAVLSCRSAAENGVGFAANCQAMFAIDDMRKLTDDGKVGWETLDNEVFDIFYESYKELLNILYSTSSSKVSVEDIIAKRMPINLNNCTEDKNVITSIESDITILSTVGKIIGIMATCNQFILPTPMYNVYDNDR